MSKEKSAIEQLRERIAVINTEDPNANGVTPESNEDDEGSEDAAEVEDVETTEAVETEDTDETLSENAEEIEESEDKQKELEKEQKQAKDQKEKDRIQRKIDREVAKRKVLEDENAELKRQLEAKNAEDGEKYTKEDAEQLAKELAKKSTDETEFANICNKIANDGEKIVGKDGKPLGKQFITNLTDMAAEVGAIPPDMIYILGELDNGASILHYLASDDGIDEAEKIMGMSTHKKAIALTKISNKLSAPKPKPISNVPAPNAPISSGARGGKQLTDNMTDKEWIEARRAQIAERQASRRY